jgi:hypothetical protein
MNSLGHEPLSDSPSTAALSQGHGRRRRSPSLVLRTNEELRCVTEAPRTQRPTGHRPDRVRRPGARRLRIGRRISAPSSPWRTSTAGRPSRRKPSSRPSISYGDFRKLLERDDIHVIVNGTPDHWHTLVNVAAARAGKDIYSEKPLTLTIEEGKRLVKEMREREACAARSAASSAAIGKFRLACELVRNGRIGKLEHIIVGLPTGPREGPFPKQPVPAGDELGFLPRADAFCGIQWQERPLELPLVVPVLRRTDDRLGRPPQRHRPVGEWHRPLGARSSSTASRWWT